MNKQLNEILCDITDSHGRWDTEFMDKFSKKIVEACADTIDTWGDSGKFETFGQRLKAHFTEN